MTRHSQTHDVPVATTMPARRPHTHLNRVQLLGLGAGLMLTAVPSRVSAAPARAISGTAATIQDILNVLVTLERFGVAVVTANLTGKIQPRLHPLHIPIEQASVAAFLAQTDFWESRSGRSLTDTFTLPVPPGESTPGLQAKEQDTVLYVGAFTAAARQFAELGQPHLATYACQTASVHAENRALARAVLILEGVPHEMPPADKAFETDLFRTVRDAYKAMSDAGLFGRLSVPVPYPTRAAVLAAAGPMARLIVQTTPNGAAAH